MKFSKKIAGEGARLFDVTQESLKYIGGDDGDVYEFEKDGLSYVLKINPSSQNHIQGMDEKLKFVLYLAENGVPAAVPQHSVNGTNLEPISVRNGFVAVSVSEKAEGHHVHANSPEWGSLLFQHWGSIMGRIHQLTKNYNGGNLIGDWQGEIMTMREFCSSEPEILKKWDEMENYLQTIPREKNNFGLVHNDLHQYNFRVNNGKIEIFDFDVAIKTWFMTDIGIPLYHSWSYNRKLTPKERETFIQGFYNDFMKGYSTHNSLDYKYLKELPQFMKYRQLLHYSVFHQSARRPGASKGIKKWMSILRRGILEGTPIVDKLS